MEHQVAKLAIPVLHDVMMFATEKRAQLFRDLVSVIPTPLEEIHDLEWVEMRDHKCKKIFTKAFKYIDYHNLALDRKVARENDSFLPSMPYNTISCCPGDTLKYTAVILFKRAMQDTIPCACHANGSWMIAYPTDAHFMVVMDRWGAPKYTPYLDESMQLYIFKSTLQDMELLFNQVSLLYQKGSGKDTPKFVSKNSRNSNHWLVAVETLTNVQDALWFLLTAISTTDGNSDGVKDNALSQVIWCTGYVGSQLRTLMWKKVVESVKSSNVS